MIKSQKEFIKILKSKLHPEEPDNKLLNLLQLLSTMPSAPMSPIQPTSSAEALPPATPENIAMTSKTELPLTKDYPFKGK